MANTSAQIYIPIDFAVQGRQNLIRRDLASWLRARFSTMSKLQSLG